MSCVRLLNCVIEPEKSRINVIDESGLETGDDCSLMLMMTWRVIGGELGVACVVVDNFIWRWVWVLGKVMRPMS